MPYIQKGDVMDICNYRSISILPTVSKIFEKEVVNQMNEYFEYVLSPYVSGFGTRRSCETVFVRMLRALRSHLTTVK